VQDWGFVGFCTSKESSSTLSLGSICSNPAEFEVSVLHSAYVHTVRAYYIHCARPQVESGIRPIPCTHLLPKSPLRASVTLAFLVARIGAQNKCPCVHPFQEWPLYAFVFKSLKTNIWIRTSDTSIFSTGFLQQRMALNVDTAGNPSNLN